MQRGVAVALALRDRHKIRGLATEADIDRVIDSFGIERAPDQPLVGRIRGMLLGGALVLNRSLTEGWRRAVKAHELGHYLLHRGSHFYISESNARMVLKQAEREAHVFAGALLLGSLDNEDYDARLHAAFDEGVPIEFLFAHQAALAHGLALRH